LRPERVSVIHLAGRMTDVSEQIMQGLPIGLRGREGNDFQPVARSEGCRLIAAADSLKLDNDAMQIARALNSAA
jgi:hypothetical protein